MAASKRKREDAAVATSADVIELLVGGRSFTTRLATLQFEEESMLAKLFADESPFGEVPTTSSGTPFLDRDPDTFALILNYLRRSGRFVGHEGLSPDLLAQLREDAEYFGLAGLVAAVDGTLVARAAAKAKATAEREKKRKEEVAYVEGRADARVKDAEGRAATRKQENVVQYVRKLIGPLVGKAEAHAEKEREAKYQRSMVNVRRFTQFGFRIAHVTADARGDYLEVLLERETNEQVHWEDDGPDPYSQASAIFDATTTEFCQHIDAA